MYIFSSNVCGSDNKKCSYEKPKITFWWYQVPTYLLNNTWTKKTRPQSILDWKSMYVTKQFEKYSRLINISAFKWNSNWWASFFKNPPDGAGHSLKSIESRNQHLFDFIKLFETVNFVFMWKNYLLVKKHRKVNFVIFHRRFMSSNFSPRTYDQVWRAENLMT